MAQSQSAEPDELAKHSSTTRTLRSRRARNDKSDFVQLSTGLTMMSEQDRSLVVSRR